MFIDKKICSKNSVFIRKGQVIIAIKLRIYVSIPNYNRRERVGCFCFLLFSQYDIEG